MRRIILTLILLWSLWGLWVHASFQPIDTYGQVVNTIYQNFYASYCAGELSDQERVWLEGESAQSVMDTLKYPVLIWGGVEGPRYSFENPKIIRSMPSTSENHSTTPPNDCLCHGRQKDYSLLSTLKENGNVSDLLK